MRGFEFLHNITIGEYLPTGSALHRLHPATKMLIAGVAIVGAIVCGSISGLLFALLSVMCSLRIARIPLAYAFRGVKTAVPIIILVAVLQIIFGTPRDGGTLVWHGWVISVTTGDFLAAAVMALRLVVLILIVTLFTLSTGAKELTHGSESLLKPLARLGFPAHEFAMVITVALRFLPILAEEAEHLVKAQASRGADFGRGRMGLFKRVFRMMPLFLPLFLVSLRRGERLALAMEARCYTGGKGRTQLIRFHYRKGDLVAAITAAAAVAAMLALNFARVDAVVWRLIT